jgi:ornithine lipid ester-linked acyl 2-hydroxylase
MKTPVWFSYQGGRPVDEGISFHDPEQFTWVKQFLSNYEEIRKEIETLVEQEKSQMRVYFNKTLVTSGSKWKTFSFKVWGINFKKRSLRAPILIDSIKSIPGIVSCSISMLEPGSRIKPHHGDTNAIIRCHLPITIPGKLPESGFRVGADTREWKHGELLMFNDSEEHEAWNLSDKDRVILIIDLMRPEYIHMTRDVCANVLAGLAMQALTGNVLLRWSWKRRSLRLAGAKVTARIAKMFIHE